jgi:hypothetical protein
VALSNRSKRVVNGGASMGPSASAGIQRPQTTSAFHAPGFLQAVRAREYGADAPPGGIQVWKYAFPFPANQPVEYVQIRYRSDGTTPSVADQPWVGIFECARDRHVDVLFWAAADAIVVAAANALYIVNPHKPEQFSGLAAPAEITGVTFDEAGEHMFAAGRLRLYAFSSDRLFRWISESFEGYVTRFCGCGRRVLAVEVKQWQTDLDGEETASSIMRLRTEDGTILRSRFRLARRYRTMDTAA